MRHIRMPHKLQGVSVIQAAQHIPSSDFLLSKGRMGGAGGGGGGLLSLTQTVMDRASADPVQLEIFVAIHVQRMRWSQAAVHCRMRRIF